MVIERLIEVAKNVLEDVDFSEISEDSSLEEMGVNSISMLMLMVNIEDEFGITFPVERVGELKTVGEVADVIKECLHVSA